MDITRFIIYLLLFCATAVLIVSVYKITQVAKEIPLDTDSSTAPQQARLDIKDAIIKLGQTYQKLTPEEKEMARQKFEPVVNVLNTIIPSTVITAGNFIITYRNITFKFTTEEIKSKLDEIVAANPGVDMKKLQGPLGVQIVDVQGGRTRVSDGDIYS